MIGRYSRLYLLLLKSCWMKTLEYRVDFISTLIPTMSYSLGYLLFLNIIMSKIPNIIGWTHSQMIMFFSLEQLSYYLSWFWFRNSIDVFCNSVRDGEFDYVIKYPVNLRFFVTFKVQDLNVFFPIFLPLTLFIYGLIQNPISLGNFILGLILFLLGFIIYYNIFFAVSALTFWFTDMAEAIGLIDELQTYSRYPKEVYPGPIAFLLLTIFPAMLFVYVPVQAFIGLATPGLVILSLIATLISFYLSQAIWRRGLRHYSSASS